MYKITLYDDCCNPICDGIHFFFVENLENFEANWLPLQAKNDIDTINRYFRSKFGEIVTDYYSDDPELNIVQEITIDIVEKLEYTCSNMDIALENVYECKTKFNFDTLTIKLIKAKIEDQYMLLGQYKGTGGKRISKHFNRWYNIETNYSQMNFYGNNIANYHKRHIDWDKTNTDDAYKDFYTNDESFYKDETVETFVWLPIQKITKDYKLIELNTEQLAILMRDIVGEAG